jgi:hypothetical protein
MNNNSLAIDNYLQNKMNDSERTAFEAQLVADKELQYEVDVQQQVIKAAQHAGLKMEFAKAIRKKIIIKKAVTWAIIIVVSVTTIVLYNFRHSIFSNKIAVEQQGTVTQQATDSSQPFINPPMQAINVPFSEYSFDAATGDTIFHASGSVIYFPPLALVDEAGNTIKGTVKITYREFADPIDFFVSGIPMQYDSAGKKYNFESSGMCEINAYQDNKAVFVNPKARPQINLSSKNKSPLHNVYFLDTVTHNWKYNGKDIITEVKKTVRSKAPANNTMSFENVYEALPAKPLKPMKANDGRQAFSIEIDPGSFEELFAYDRLKFEVIDESTYKRSDADEHWSKVKLERSNKEGVYSITFTNAVRKVSYKVRPVLEGKDYEAALKVFNEKNKVYEEALRNRLIQQDIEADSINLKNKQLQGKWNADNEWNNKVNALIVERNKRMKALRQRKMEEMEKQIQADKQMAEDQFLLIERNQAKYSMDMRLTAEIMRTFTISNFGVWNCDHPQYPTMEVPLFASYTDSSNNTIDLRSIAVVYKGFNGITQFSAGMPIRVIPGSENMIWSVVGESFYYFTYTDFMNAGINSSNRAYTFRMRKSVKKVSSYNEIRALVEKL